MTYPTLMVHLELGQANAGVLKIAADLAERFGSRVVGIASGKAVATVRDVGYMSGDQVEGDLRRLEMETDFAQARFRAAFHASGRRVEWRSKILSGPASDYLANEARCADLFVTGGPSGRLLDGTRCNDAGGLVLQLGRPVLVVPESVDALKLGYAVVCWKDTREARRAAADALSLLKLFDRVEIVEVVASEEDLVASRARLDDVAAWLRLHDVPSTRAACVSRGDERGVLAAVLLDRQADLAVAGAYGHHRLQEWCLGGVSRDFIVGTARSAFLSH